MKNVKDLPILIAAGLLPAALLITGCGSEALITPVSVEPSPTQTVIEIVPTVTPTTASSTTPTPSPMSTASPSFTPTHAPTNTSTATSIPPSATPSHTARPTPTVTPANIADFEGVQAYETLITLPTYPYREYLVEQVDPLYNMPVYYFNRPQFEADAPPPVPADYTGVVLENPYLRLTFLPELGGRLYSAVVKATGQEVFYHNPVIKPSRYGVLQPYEANWWLATGGMEWAYPTQEHGYRFGVPWHYEVDQNQSGAAITLSDTAPGRVGLRVTVTLPAKSAAFRVSPQLVNNGPEAAPVQLWTNAALTLSPGSMASDTQFVAPTEVITVHSRGEAGWSVPAEKTPAPWPLVDSTDLRDYTQWANYLGFFVPNQSVPFIGAVNPENKLAMVRLAGPGLETGSGKLFAFGLNFTDRSYTDDDSQYFEIWGGANEGFWPENDLAVSPGQRLGWQETWWPLAGLQGLTWATQDIAIHLAQNGDKATLSAVVVRPTQGQIQVVTGGETILAEPFATNPANPLQWQFQAGRTVEIVMRDAAGNSLLTYQFETEK